MQHIITVVEGKNAEFDYAAEIAKSLIAKGLVQEFRPADTVGGLEIIPTADLSEAEWHSIIKAFKDEGFDVIED